MKTFLAVLLSFSLSAANLEVFPEFHPTPRSILDDLLRRLKTGFLRFKDGAIVDELDNGCIRINKYGLDTWQCYKYELVDNGDEFQYHSYELRFEIWDVTRTLYIRSYNEQKPFSEADIRYLNFVKKDESFDIVFSDRAMRVKHRTSEKGFSFSLINEKSPYQISYEQIDSENRYMQFLEVTCNVCSLKGYRVTASRIQNDLFEFFYQKQDVADFALPSQYSRYILYGVTTPIEREASRIDLGYPNF